MPFHKGLNLFTRLIERKESHETSSLPPNSTFSPIFDFSCTLVLVDLKYQNLVNMIHLSFSVRVRADRPCLDGSKSIFSNPPALRKTKKKVGSCWGGSFSVIMINWGPIKASSETCCLGFPHPIIEFQRWSMCRTFLYPRWSSLTRKK